MRDERQTRELVLLLDERVQILQKDVAKLEQNFSAFQTSMKIDLDANRTLLEKNLCQLSGRLADHDETKQHVEKLLDKTADHDLEIRGFKRDKAWMYGIFSAAWAGIVLWIKVRITGS